MNAILQAALDELRAALAAADLQADEIPAEVETPAINPSVSLHEADWLGLPSLLDAQDSPDCEDVPEARPGRELLLVWRDPGRGRAVAQAAEPQDLLALKIAGEGLAPAEAARQAGTTPAAIRAALDAAASKGLVLLPPSRLARASGFSVAPVPDELRRARIFTLQWHITQACDLRCRHCYDRSPRDAARPDDGLRLLDQMAAFCDDRRVQGQVSFSGGNPLLHPDFEFFYAEAVRRGLLPVILGNPTPRQRLERLCAIAKPAAFQVSLEGLAEHDDFIRGPGHFARTLDFLDLLREFGVYSMVMLTLTRANQEQLLPLAEALRGRADLLCFNRLSLFGEGASLACADPQAYPAFLDAYLDAAAANPILGLKDGLLNLALERRGEPLFGGCAGHGCGAAFNFLAVLPDGEVHACRKFPSKVGDLRAADLAAIYDSHEARAYRQGSAACRECGLKPRCGGCLAVTASHGLDPLTARDPYCFRDG